MIVPSIVTTASSQATPVILKPTVTQVSESVNVVTPTVNPVNVSRVDQFTQYALGAAQPHDVLIDSAGNAWISEPGANKIVRLTDSTPDFVMDASPQAASIVKGESSIVSVGVTPVASYGESDTSS